MAGPVAYTLGRLIVDLYSEQVGVTLAEVRSFRKYLGGSAANTAVGLSRLGAAVGLISRVGPDDFGTYLLDRLREEGVDTAMVRRDDQYPTGLAFAALRPPGDSQVLFYRKPCADANLYPEDIDVDRLRQARLLVVAGTALAVSPGREAALLALEICRQAGATTVLDVDWRPMFWRSPVDAQLYYRMALRMSDVVLANETELEVVGGSADPRSAADALFGLGVREVVAKRGGEGCYYFGPGGPLRAAAVPVRVLNTLGAGDAFGAAYAFGLLAGWPPEERLRFANAAGAIVVGRHSCSEAMPRREEVERVLALGRWEEDGP